MHLYDEPSSKSLNINEIANYVREMVKCDVDVKREFFTHFLGDSRIDNVARKLAIIKVIDPRKDFAPHDAEPLEIEFEKKVLSSPGKRMLGILYDGFEFQSILNELIPEEENSLDHVHLVFTNRLICTFSENDYRYHYRTVVCGYPTIVCTSGIVEAPAKPREFYLLQQYYASIGNTNLEEIKKRFQGRFIDYDDARLTEVMKGIVLQGLFYHIAGDPFCSAKKCRLFNAHWQEDLIESQLGSGALCDTHKNILNGFNSQMMQN